MSTDLLLKEQQLEFQKLARDFAMREISPRALSGDKDGALPAGIIAKIKDLGLLNVGLPEEFGGLGLTTLDACVIAEELAAACSGIASVTESSEVALTPLLLQTSRPATELLRQIGQDMSLLGASCNIESEIEKQSLVATTLSDGGYALQGQCESVANGGIADWLFVMAVVDKPVSPAVSSPGRQTIGLYIKSSAKGVKTEPRLPSLGRRAASFAAVTFAEVLVPESHVIDLGNDPAAIVHAIAQRNNPIIAAGCVGVARAALDQALRYALERQTFKQPIANHQGVGFMLADMKKDVEAARLMTQRAACVADAGGASPVESLHLTCRAYAQEMVMNVTTDAVQIFGGYGYSKEYPVEKLMRDAKMYDLGGTPACHLKGSIGRALLAGGGN